VFREWSIEDFLEIQGATSDTKLHNHEYIALFEIGALIDRSLAEAENIEKGSTYVVLNDVWMTTSAQNLDFFLNSLLEFRIHDHALYRNNEASILVSGAENL